MIDLLHFVASRVRHSRPVRRWDWLWKTLDPAWQDVFARLHRNRGLLTYVNGDAFRLDLAFGERYGRFNPQTYERAVYQAFTDAIRPGMCVFDIGASHGIFALGAAKRVGSGRVYAFEPLPETAAALRRHVLLNRCQDRVETIEAAVGRVDGATRLYTSHVTNMASLSRANAVLDREWLGDRVVEVPVEAVTLDAFCERSKVRPDVMKVDAEGAELHVLEGARHVLEEAQPLVFCEVHPRQMLNCGSSLAEFQEFLAGIGYVQQLITEPRNGGIFHSRMVRAPAGVR